MRRGACGFGLAALLTGCLEPTLIKLESDTDDATATDGSSSSTSDATTTTGGPPSGPMTSSSSGAQGTTGDPTSGGASTSDGDDDGGGPGSGPPSLGPDCSVQEVTRGDIYNPLPRGGAGEFPFPVADALEDYCGCHTLENNRQNIEWEFLRPPASTLFLTLGELSGGYQGTTLGNAMAQSIGGEMPPGSCGNPSADAMDLLLAWFEQGMPDAVDYEG